MMELELKTPVRLTEKHLVFQFLDRRRKFYIAPTPRRYHYGEALPWMVMFEHDRYNSFRVFPTRDAAYDGFVRWVAGRRKEGEVG